MLSLGLFCLEFLFAEFCFVVVDVVVVPEPLWLPEQAPATASERGSAVH